MFSLISSLIAIVLIGSLFAYLKRKQPIGNLDDKLYLELSNASQIAEELQQVAQQIGQDVATHQASITQFKARINRQKLEGENGEGWQTLSSEAEMLLAPTMKLATNLSQAYDQLSKQSTLLMNFTGSRSDPQTGVYNRRAMEEQLDVLFALHEQNKSRFSLALFSVETFCEEESEVADSHELLRSFAELLENCARDSDFVARYSTDEFVVLMPQTILVGATIFAGRLLERVDTELLCITDGGVVEVLFGDTPEKLLSRADSALYSARANGGNCLYQHTGKTIRPLETHRGTGVDQHPKAESNEPAHRESDLTEPTVAVACPRP